MRKLLHSIILLLAFIGTAAAQTCPSIITSTGGATSCWVPPSSGTTIADLLDSNPATIAAGSTFSLQANNTLGCGIASSSQPQNINGGCTLTTGQLYSPTALTLVMTFSGTGGPLAQFASTSSTSAPYQYYELYLDTLGRLSWGVTDYGIPNVLQSGRPDHPQVYADGNQHTVVASLGSAGMKLYVDGSLVGSRVMSLANYSSGYWLFGSANLTGGLPSGAAWPFASAQNWFNGTLYSWAWFPLQLSDTQAEAISNPGTNPPTSISNNYVTLTGQIASYAVSQGLAYANSGVTFHSESAQLPACGSTIPIAPSSQTYYTDSQGNLPAGLTLPQGAHVTMQLGNGPGIPLVMPCQSTVSIANLIPAQTPMADSVTNIALGGPLFQGTSVANPAPGTANPATLTAPGTVNNTCNGTTVTLDRALGPQQNCTLSANTTITFTHLLDGPPPMQVDIIENNVGGFTPTFSAPSGFTLVWPLASQPTQTTTANSHTFYNFVVEGTVIEGYIVSPVSVFPLTQTANFNSYSGTNINQLNLSALVAPTPGVVATCSGTCATTYTYELVCLGDNSSVSDPSSTATATNAAALGAGNINTISWTANPACYGGIRIVGRVGGSLGVLATCPGSGNCTGASYVDDGSASVGAAPAISGNTGVMFGYAPNIPHGQQVFTTTGTFTAPTGVYAVNFACWGSGGGGGGFGTSPVNGGAGNATTVTHNSGGVTDCAAAGGTGGTSSASGDGAGGAGGAGTTGSMQITGGTGMAGHVNDGSTSVHGGGMGGISACPGGNGGPGGGTGAATTGGGGGGAGGCSDAEVSTVPHTPFAITAGAAGTAGTGGTQNATAGQAGGVLVTW